MASELLPTMGDIRPHGHLKLGRFTQHFVDVLDLEKTPLEFFEATYPNDPREEQRKYLGRFGVSGAMQVQKMAELSDGQKSRVVFAKLGRDVPHIVSAYDAASIVGPNSVSSWLTRRYFLFTFSTLPTRCSCSWMSPQITLTWNVSPVVQYLVVARLADGGNRRSYLSSSGPVCENLHRVKHMRRMVAIDALAKAVNEFQGGLVLVSHDMRLISQVAKEIWICDNKTITTYRGDIMNFKMDMRDQLGIGNDGGNKVGKLKGDASVKANDKPKEKPAPKKPQPKLEVIKPPVATIREEPPPPAVVETVRAPPAPAKMEIADDATAATISTATSANSGGSSSFAAPSDGGEGPKRYIPPHLRKKMTQ